MRSPSVIVEARAAYELLMSLAVVADRDEAPALEIGPEWLARVHSLAGPELIESVRRLSGDCGWVFGNVLGLAIDTPEPRDGAAFARHLAALPARELHLALVGATIRPFRRQTPAETMEAAIDGDPTARRSFLRTSFPEHPTWPAALEGLLSRSSLATKGLLLQVVKGWNERVFRHEGPALMAVAERDAAEKGALAADLTATALIDLATRGWDYVPEPGVTRVILAPSVVQRPWVTTCDHGDTRIFCYSVADESFGATRGDPPAFLVRRLKALGDARRLLILHRLGAERRTLQELATEFGMPKTTLHHHLAVLRAAGLIRLRDDASRQYSPLAARYDLLVEAIPGTWEALTTYLSLEDRPCA